MSPMRKLLIPLLATVGVAALALTVPDILRKNRPDWPTPGQAGPVLGNLAPGSAQVWFRASPGAGGLRLRFGEGGAFDQDAGLVTPSSDADYCIRWTIRDLPPDAEIAYRIEDADGKMISPPQTFRSPGAGGLSGVLIAGSCADEKEGTSALWRKVAAANPAALLLLGDTPYIDTTDLSAQRIRYRDVAATPGFAELAARVPVYSVWDDHDFGGNDRDGTLPGKENSLRAFREYRVNPSYGDGTEGLYFSFTCGEMEVFVLDTRWFAGLEKLPEGGRSLLGAKQREWLRRGLKASTKPFKVMASGVVWHDGIGDGKKDAWPVYAEEREALFRFIGAERISGVMVLGGDIHQSLFALLPVKEQAGYDIPCWTSSPLHGRNHKTIPGAAAGQIYRGVEPHVWLELSTQADTGGGPTLTGRIMSVDGRALFERMIPAAVLVR